MPQPVPGTSAWKHLISRTFPSHEVVSLVEGIFEDEEEVRALNDLRGDDAQTFIDVIHEVRFRSPSPKKHVLIGLVGRFTLSGSFVCADQALDSPNLLLWLRRECLTTLSRMCGRHALLPRSLQIPLCYNRLDTPLYDGGSANVWRGNHEGRPVAVKALKVYQSSNIVRIRSVGSFCMVRVCIKRLILAHVEVLQRGCDMESSPPSKRAATFGSDNGRFSIRDGIGVDAEWERQ